MTQQDSEDTRCAPFIDDDYLEARKVCVRNEDCALVGVRTSCCENKVWVGVTRDSADDVSDCAAAAPPVCTCDARPDRAEDGRAPATFDARDLVTQCVDERCRSSVAERSCGSRVRCQPHELCVSFGDASGLAAGTGDNAYIAYTCVPNPCPDKLECACAQAICDREPDVYRKCEIDRNTDSDVACVPYRD